MTAEELVDLQVRLVRIESMLCYLLGSQKLEVEAAPTPEQAKRLQAMGMKPWERVKRSTNSYQLWREGFEKKMAEQAAPTPEGAPHEAQ